MRPVFESANILIRHFEPEDFALYCKLWDDEVVRKNFRVDQEKARNWKGLERFNRICTWNVPGEFAIVERKVNTMIGRAQFGQAGDFGSDSQYDLEVMIALLQTARRRGFGQEATEVLIECLCVQCGAKRIFAKAVSENTKSREMAKRLGFSETVVVKSVRDPESIVLVLERDDWHKSVARAQLIA